MLKKKITLIIIFMILFQNKLTANYEEVAYDFKFNDIDGNVLELESFKNKVLIVINVASKCGFTRQYEDMQNLWNKYRDKGLIVLGIPTNDFNQEPGNNKEIKNFCESKFGITFPMTEKISVKGNNIHPFYEWAVKNHGSKATPKWNFHKIIINKEGKIETTFSSLTKPTSNKITNIIENLLKK